MTSFKATGLGPEILSAIADLGYKTPTPIQEKAIPFLLKSDTDLIALAQTGTGKTAAFGLPMLQRLDPDLNAIQALILCPTRELALQIVSDFENYSRNISQLNVVAIYGGASAERQIQQLRKGAQVVVGTPGRTRDLIERGELNVRDIEWLVLDEADEMLDRGFKHDLDAILSGTPKDKRTLLFSATMPEHISEIARNYLHKPKQVSVARLNAGAENVEHHYYVVPPRERYRYLRQLLRETEDMYGIVFCRTKRKTREVARRLRRDGFTAGALEGDMPQNRRDKVMKRFRDKELNLLIATDVAARGVDVADLSHVVNFNLPDEDAVYIHRSGRTGRAGKTGISIALLSEEEADKIPPLEKLADKKFSKSTLKEPPAPREPRSEESEANKKAKAERKEARQESGDEQQRKPRDGRKKEERKSTRDNSERERDNGRGRRQEPEAERKNDRGKGRNNRRQEEEKEDGRGKGKGRGRKPEAERKNDKGRGGRNDRDRKRGDRNDRDRGGRNSRQEQQGEPLRRKTERAYDSVPVLDASANRRRKGGAKKTTKPEEIKALTKALRKANPNQAHLKKILPAIFDELDQYTWEEVIGKFVAYLDDQGLLEPGEQEEAAPQPTGLKALFRGFARR